MLAARNSDQRYYSSAIGRFLTPDPYLASGGPADPQSWNRYAYTRSDPVNRIDRTGLQDEGPPYDPYEGLLSLILDSLRRPVYENGEPERLPNVPDLLQESTIWGRGWGVEGLKRINRNCGDQLRRDVPGQTFSIGKRLAEVAQTALIIQTWDPATMNASYGEVFGGTVSQSMSDWLKERFGDWKGANSWSGANAGTIIAISEKGAETLTTTMETLVHELLHQTLSGSSVGATHVGLAQALGIYRDFSRLGPEADQNVAQIDVDSWLKQCIGGGK